MWGLYQKLHQKGVMSINQRNMDYVLRYNPRHLYPLVDDKLKTKKLAIDANIAVPPLYTIIETEHQIQELEHLLSPFKDFVIKPASGSGGDGILVITDKVFGRWRQINGRLLTLEDLSYHLSCLLSGAYSLGGHADYAIVEHRVVVDPVFSDISYEGIPDIRIITLLGYPAMAMVRLPTRQSGGKANLHQGAIGVGICLATGKTLGGVHHNERIEFHPDTLKSIHGMMVPYWDTILDIASRCYEITGLGYVGVDIVLDKEKGPLVLELNARPGLNIQIANHEGLLKRCQKIEAHVAQLTTPESPQERVAFSRLALSHNESISV